MQLSVSSSLRVFFQTLRFAPLPGRRLPLRVCAWCRASPAMAEDAPDPMAEMRRKIMEIERDTTLSAEEKAVRRQQVMNPRFVAKGKAAAVEEPAGARAGTLPACPRPDPPRVRCSAGWRRGQHARHHGRGAQVCLLLQPVRPARDGACPIASGCAAPGRSKVLRTQAPCQHNFCLGCFTKWVQQSKTSCPKCRASIPQSMRSNPRINAALVNAIRMVRSCARCRPRGSTDAYRARMLLALSPGEARRAGAVCRGSGRQEWE